MPGKGTTDAMFALRMLIEKHREGQRELHCVFVDLKKAYNRVPREEFRGNKRNFIDLLTTKMYCLNSLKKSAQKRQK